MENITAEEFVKQFRKNNPIAEAESIEHWMAQHCIEFAKLKCKEMQEAIINNATTKTDLGNPYDPESEYSVIDEDSIVNAYDINNMK